MAADDRVQHVVGQDAAQGPVLVVDHDDRQAPGVDQPVGDLTDVGTGGDGNGPRRPHQPGERGAGLGQQQLAHGNVIGQAALGVHDDDRVQVGDVVGVPGEALAHLRDRILRMGDDQEGRHRPARGVGREPEHRAQPLGRLLRQRLEKGGPVLLAEVAQGVGGLVGLHPRHQPGRPGRVGLGQQLVQLLRVHLFQRVRGRLRLDQLQQFLALPAAEVLQQVGQLRGAQRVELAAVPGQAPALAGIRPEGLHRGPVDDRLGGGTGPPAGRAQQAQQRSEADVDAHQPHRLADRRHVQVRRPDDAGPVDVHQLVIQDLGGQGGLAGAGHEIAQVQPGGGQEDLALAERGHRVGGDERAPGPDLDDHAGQRRVRVVGVPADHDVHDPAHHLAVAVVHGPAQQPGQRDQGLADFPGQLQAARAPLEPVPQRRRRRGECHGQRAYPGPPGAPGRSATGQIETGGGRGVR